MGIEQIPDINKIREAIKKQTDEIPDYQEDINKKERERIEEEYKRSSKQEKPTEEKVEEKVEEIKDKVKPEEKLEGKEGEEKGIKDEDIIQKLTPENVKAAENIKAAYKKGKFIEVKVRRSSGEIEDGWVISKINPKTGEATVLKFTSEKGKDRSFVDKIVTLEELKEWNKPKTEEPEEKKEADKTEIGELLKKAKTINVDDIINEKAIDVDDTINEKTKKKKEKGPTATKASGNEAEGPKEKENLEKEITEKYSDELKKIKDMPNKAEGFNKTAKLQMEKAEKCFQLIESWKDSAYLDNYKGIKEVVSELDKLKPSISFYYNIKKTQAVNKIGLTMALNYKEWDLEDKKKLKIIKNFVNGKLEKENVFYSKDKTLKGIAKILVLKDIPYKNNIDVIVKEIKNPNIKTETIAEMIDIEKDSIKKKEQSLKTLKEDMKHDKLPPEKIIIEQLEKLGIDPKALSKILSKAPKLVETFKNPEVQKKIQELRNTIEKVTKEKGEIPEAVAKAKEHIEKKESGWRTVPGAAGWLVTLILMLFIGILMKGGDWLSGQAVGGKKKEKK